MNVGIIGSRERDSEADFNAVLAAFRALAAKSPVTCIVSGGCRRGGDRFAEVIADIYDLPIAIFYPDWKRDGRAAGFVRNGDIAKKSHDLIACVSAQRKGGTEDTIRKFEQAHSGKRAIIVDAEKGGV